MSDIMFIILMSFCLTEAVLAICKLICFRVFKIYTYIFDIIGAVVMIICIPIAMLIKGWIYSIISVVIIMLFLCILLNYIIKCKKLERIARAEKKIDKGWEQKIQ